MKTLCKIFDICASAPVIIRARKNIYISLVFNPYILTLLQNSGSLIFLGWIYDPFGSNKQKIHFK